MSKEKSTPANDGRDKKTTGGSRKPKSTGFIETSDFKPNWLETGPLSPDILPDEDAPKEALTADEFEILQSSLQRFYRESGDERYAEVPEAAELADSPADAPADAHAEVESADVEVDAVSSEAIEAVDEPYRDALQVEAVDAADVAPDWIAALTEAEPPTVAAAVPQVAPPPEELSGFDETAYGYDEFIEEIAEEPEAVAEAELVAEPAAVAEPVAAAPPKAEVKRRKKRRKRRRDRLSLGLLLGSLLLFAAGAMVYYLNPFSRLALGSASLARPASSTRAPSPAVGSGEWCLSGDFLADSAALQRLSDSGTTGDFLAADGVFSIEQVIAEPGAYEWQVVDCNDPDLAYPQAPSWITTTTADQPVTFNFDSNERSDPLFFPIPFVVSADDGTSNFRVIGTFQDWNPDDASGDLQRINIGLYQQVRRISRAGTHEAYVIAGDQRNAIDAYGRTTEPIPFSFETKRNGDYVVFLMDTDRGRASVMYDMSPVLISLAYGNGHLLLSLLLGVLGLLLLLGLLARLLVLNNKNLRLESGCPNCGRHELMRISRRSSQRMLHVFGIPAYRYRCRNCIWEGTRLSDEGLAVSPGVALAHFDER